MSTIRIKRSSVSGNPATLAAGELAYSGLTDNGSNGGDRLYVGLGTETGGNAANHIVIGGKFFTDRLDHTAGVLTNNKALVVGATGKLDTLNVDNITLDGNTISTTDTNGNLTLTPNGTGKVSIAGAYTLPRVDGTIGYTLTTDGAGVVSWSPSTGSLNINGSSGSGTVSLTSQSLTVIGSGAITTVASGQTITVSFNTSTLVATAVLAVSATTATSAATAYALANTGTTYVGRAVIADSATTATSAATAYALANTSTTQVGYATNATNATNATTATSAAVAYSWVGGTVPNAVTFGGEVTFSGSATFVSSTSTLYTDNILEIHTPPGGMDALWTVDDGKDIGFHMHYYKSGADHNGALLLRNDSKYLEWFQDGTDSTSNGNNFTATTYGTFKTGSIILADPTAANSTNTGALQVQGGVGVGGSIFVAGVVTATTFLGNLTGTASTATSAATAYSLANTATTYVGRAVLADSATNLAGGTTGALPYQTSAGVTGFLSVSGASGQILQVSTITGLAIWGDIDGGTY